MKACQLHQIIHSRSFLLVLLILLARPHFLPGQHAGMQEVLSSGDGLSQNSVYSITQDHRGFLWVATGYGLSRWDGIRFRNFIHSQKNRGSLSGNSLLCTYVSPTGTIWTGTNGEGICRYDPENESFLTFRDSTSTKPYENNTIWSVAEDRSGQLWAGTFGGGLKVISKQDGKIIRKYEPEFTPGLKSADVRSVFAGSDEVIWAGFFDGGILSVERGGTVTKYILPGEKKMRILHLLPDKSSVWIATYRQGFLKLNKKTGLFTSFPALKGLHIRCIAQDPQNPDILWLASWEKGICRFDKSSGRLSDSYPEVPFSNEELPEKSVTSLFFDSNGILWAGTYNSGLVKLNISPPPFRSLLTEGQHPSFVIYSVQESGSGIFAGTFGKGLISTEKNGAAIRHDWLREKSQVVHCILEDRGKLWVGSGNGLFYLDPASSAIQGYFPDSENAASISDQSVTSALKDSHGRYWFGTYGGGLNQFFPDSRSFRRYKHNAAKEHSLSENTVLCLLEDRYRRLWVGTGKGGLNLFDPASSTFRTFNDKNLGQGQEITCLAQDSHGDLWAGTDEGLVRFHFDGKKLTSVIYTTAEGLPSDIICAIQPWKDLLWVSTTRGLCSVEPAGWGAQPSVKIFGKQHGIFNEEFINGASCRGIQGHLYFGGSRGITVFHPDSVLMSGSPGSVVITAMEAFNRPVGINPEAGEDHLMASEGRYFVGRSVTESSRLVLPHDLSVFSLDFAGLDFRNPADHIYLYKLEGFDRHWNTVPTGTATYTNLSPGKYLLRLRVRSRDGAWAIPDKTLEMIVLPPWWMSVWFRVAAVLALVSGIYLFVRIRINQLQKDKIKLEEKVMDRTLEVQSKNLQLKEQTEELQKANDELLRMDAYKESLTKMLVHDLKNPLGTLVYLSSSAISDEKKQLISHSARQMHSLVMNILDVQQMKEERYEIRPGTCHLVNIVRHATSYLALGISQKNITMAISIREDLTVICDAHLLERVYLNLLANAIHYSPANSTVTITAKPGPEGVLTEVSDEGRGLTPGQMKNLFQENKPVDRSHDKYSTGIGLQFCKWALHLHGRDLAVRSEPGQGTCFYFFLTPAPEAAAEPVLSAGADKPKLTAEGKNIISSHFRELKSLKIYEGSRILKILLKIPEEYQGISDWKNKVRQSVFSLNEEQYQALLMEAAEQQKAE